MVKNNKNNFPIQGPLMWFFYIIGWMFGIFNLFFWITELIAGITAENKNKFINITFHKIVYIWGIITSVIVAIMILLMIVGFNFFFMHFFN